MFANIFFNLLEEEVDQLKEEFAYQGYINAFGGSKKPYRKTTIPKDPKFTSARHRAAIPKDPRFRKHAQLVPTSHRPDTTKIQKVELAKAGSRQVLSQDEITDVCKKYNINNLHVNAPKKLGNTGVMMKFDPQIRGYILHR